ncbi:hypothetical protein AB0K21_21810 [Streptosporangium sp. NPDC049248]|uniref:hypothetical protein n=1 Tax=Streptosporangium sp. NPDC049248 TaxID=3155651 RepID=UPI003415FE57
MNDPFDTTSNPFDRRKKKRKPRKVNGKRVPKRKRTPDYSIPRHSVVSDSGVVIAIVEGHGVTQDDLDRARAIALGVGLAHTGGM